MRILLTGASGFIGGRLLQALVREGHRVITVSRREVVVGQWNVQHLARDFSRAINPADWVGAVQDIDVVINAVGILRETRGQRFDDLHHRAPAALFRAAVAAGVPRIVQVSALGADESATTPYHLSKKAADDVLCSLSVEGIIVQPSLVYGPGGASAKMFSTQAAQPLIPVPGRGDQQVQPVHIDDLVEVIMALVSRAEVGREYAGRRVAVVGPEPMTMKTFYGCLRDAMGIRSPARFVPVPMPIMRGVAWVGRWIPSSPLDPDTLSMLERGNTAPSADTEAILGRAPRDVSQFVEPGSRSDMQLAAAVRWLAPVLRISVALVWFIAGIVSLGVYPVEDSLAMLAAVGVPAGLGPLALYSAAVLDIALGVLVLSPWRGRLLWAFQAAVVLTYTVILSIHLPEFWLHPFGPLAKNLPFLAVLWLMYEIDHKT